MEEQANKILVELLQKASNGIDEPPRVSWRVFYL
ncbi:Gene 34 protein [Escherichia coli]|nr:Gene 34 protein [Escherichia coli]